MTLQAKQTRVEDFSVQNNTLVRDVADRVEDRISIEIGDSKQAEFIPQAKIMRWDNETNFSIRRDNGARSFVERDGKIVAEGADENVVIYELEPDEQNEDGGLEIEIELPRRPKTNVFEFTLQTKGLNFYYQPELTEKEKAEGASQPDNVIGSYAVYHATKRDNRVGGKHYKTGKAFHIYRPKAIDADGVEVWCELNIDEQAGVLTVTVPQDWLNRASYPVRVDPTFGYTSVGAAANPLAFESSNFRLGNSYEVTLIESGTGNWTIPAGVTEIIVETWGGGGAGGGRTGFNGNGGGGGGGAYSRKTFSGLTPLDTIPYSVGAVASGSTGAGADGNVTWFYSNDSSGCVAAGGKGGTSGTPGVGGAGGLATDGHGDVKYNGGNGSNGVATTTASGAGGSGAGSTGNGNNASGTTGGGGVNELGGQGGMGRTVGGNGGGGGILASGGGGAIRNNSINRTGGQGQTGIIRITYATAAEGQLQSMDAYLGGSVAVDVTAFVNRLHGSGTYGLHNEIAKKENTGASASAGWKTFNFANESLVGTATYILSVSANSAPLVGSERYSIYADSSTTDGRFSTIPTTYPGDDPWGASYGVGNVKRRYSIYATYEAAASDPDPITKVKIAGTFVPITPKVKINGTFVEKTSKVKVGGTFV